MKLRIPSQADRKKGVRVLIRVDANVPIKNGRVVEGALGRLPRSIAEIQAWRKRGAVVILATHLGDPKGHEVPSLTTRPIAKAYEKLLKAKVRFCPTITGSNAERMSRSLKSGEVMLLENLRFDAGEEKDATGFAKGLSRLADVYVNNAFGVCHRKHASVHAVTKYLPSFAGLLVVDEVRELSHSLIKPFVLAMAGMKLETKVPLLKAMAPKASAILVGGGISVSLLAARRGEPFPLEKKILAEYGDKIVLPIDVVVRAGRKTSVMNVRDLKGAETIIDIGPHTAKRFADMASHARTVVWNGPFGIVEDKTARNGTTVFAKALSKSSARSLVGGGDTIPFLESAKITKGFSFISTGGGAMLSFLSGEAMPGLEGLKE